MHAHESRKTRTSILSSRLSSPFHILRRGSALAAALGLLAGLQCLTLEPAQPSDTIPAASSASQTKVRLTTSKGDIVIELFRQQSPKTTANFLRYVCDGFYDGTIVHSVTANTVFTAGTYDENLVAKTNGLRDPVANESNNGLSNVRGRVALVEPGGAGTDTGTSAFLIHVSDNTSQDFNLDTNQPGLTVFGQVVEGMDVVDAIGGLTTSSKHAADGTTLSALPDESVVIRHAAVENDTYPVANAGADQAVQAGEAVILNGSASSDPDGEAITFSWRQTSGPAVTLSRTDVVSPNFTPETATRLTFELTVTDEQGATGTDSVDIVVAAAGNQPPIADAGPDQVVQVTAAVTLDGSASTDPEMQTLTYLWTQTSGTTVALSDPAAADPEFTAPSTGGVLTFELKVTDPLGSQTTDSVTIRVDAAPADAGPDKNVVSGETVALNGSGPDGSTFAWTQVSGTPVALSSSTVATPTFTAPSTSGRLVFNLTATSDRGIGTTDEVIITVFIKTASGLKYCDVIKGSGDLVESDSTVSVLYTGKLDDENGDTFDTTAPNNEPREFSLSGLIEGWKEGLGHYDMRVGGKRLLIVPPDLGYGNSNSNPDIPPNSTLWFEIEVTAVR